MRHKLVPRQQVERSAAPGPRSPSSEQTCQGIPSGSRPRSSATAEAARPDRHPQAPLLYLGREDSQATQPDRLRRRHALPAARVPSGVVRSQPQARRSAVPSLLSAFVPPWPESPRKAPPTVRRGTTTTAPLRGGARLLIVQSPPPPPPPSPSPPPPPPAPLPLSYPPPSPEEGSLRSLCADFDRSSLLSPRHVDSGTVCIDQTSDESVGDERPASGSRVSLRPQRISKPLPTISRIRSAARNPMMTSIRRICPGLTVAEAPSRFTPQRRIIFRSRMRGPRHPPGEAEPAPAPAAPHKAPVVAASATSAPRS